MFAQVIPVGFIKATYNTSFPTDNNPVTANLLLYLDATRRLSYDASGSIWSDISGVSPANSATLVGSPTFSVSNNVGSFTLNGSNHAITSNLINSLSSATFIAWVNPSQIQNTYTGIIFSRAGYSGATAGATAMNFYTNNQIGYTWNDDNSTYTWESGLQTPVNQWSMVVISVNSTTATAYLCNANGISSSSRSLSHSALTGLKFYIGADPLDVHLIRRQIRGKISTAMVYSSTLSLSDITSIYNAQKFAFSSVVIGTQTLMDKNLDVTTYRNGDLIPEVTDKNTWGSITYGAWCYYNNDMANGNIYGKLYNWYAVNDPRGLAPVGWHVPTDAEWTVLGASLGGDAVAGGKMKSTTLWTSPNTGATNESGFSALPSGYRQPNYAVDFGNINTYTLWWCSDEYDSSNAYYRKLINTTTALNRNTSFKNYGFPVRVIHH